jgi:hypothetical protein
MSIWLLKNRILKAQLKERLRLSDAERAKLGEIEIGHRLGRKALGEVATTALKAADGLCRWGNPDPTSTHGETPAEAKEIELKAPINVDASAIFDPAIVQHAHPVDLRPVHRNHRHRPSTPQLKLWRVTSLSGPTVTSLSGVYKRCRRRLEKSRFAPVRNVTRLGAG